MRSIPSIPVQIMNDAISGDIEKSLSAARLAHHRKEDNLISESLTILGLANILFSSYLNKQLNSFQILTLPDLLFQKEVNLASGAVLIRLFINSLPDNFTLPKQNVLEIVSLVALEFENLPDAELLATSTRLA